MTCADQDKKWIIMASIFAGFFGISLISAIWFAYRYPRYYSNARASALGAGRQPSVVFWDGTRQDGSDDGDGTFDIGFRGVRSDRAGACGVDGQEQRLGDAEKSRGDPRWWMWYALSGGRWWA